MEFSAQQAAEKDCKHSAVVLQMNSKRNPTIRSRLALLVTSCVILASLLAIGVLTYFYQHEQIQLLSHSLATTQALKNLSSGLWEAIFLLMLGMGLVLTIGLGMCWMIANQIVRELRVLSRDALLQERIKIETAHAEVSQAIEERDRLFNYSIDFMCVAGFDGYFKQFNPALELALGWSNEEFMSRPIREFVHPDDKESTVAAQKSLYGGKSLLSFDNRYLCKDGSYRWVAWNSYPLAEKGTVLAVGRDITEHKRLEALAQQHNVELIDARNRADAANQAKSVFLANMSHELRTPLTAILGYAQILQRDKNLHPRQLTGLNTIESSGRHLLTLINDTLDFVKIEAGKLELSPHAFNLPAFLRMIADIMRVKLEQKGVLFFYETAADLPQVVRADETRLRQVLLNLLNNAAKFTDRGQVTFRVSCLPCEDESQARLRFEVQDTGIGISTDELNSIFQAFKQVGDVDRRSGGTGLGLVISRQLVQLMGSDIGVESQLDVGSRFGFEIALPVDVEVMLLPTDADQYVSYQGPCKTILIVDDMAANRLLLLDFLTPLGFETIDAVNGKEAVELLKVTNPDLILMDKVMPVMDGLEACRQISAMPGKQTIPIIVFSASATKEDQAASLVAGASAFLPKPIEYEQLLQQIGTLLALRWNVESPQPATDTSSLNSLVVPPPETLEVLYQIALNGNMRDIADEAHQLARRDECYRPFAENLSGLANKYQSKAILRLLEKFLHLEN